MSNHTHSSPKHIDSESIDTNAIDHLLIIDI